MERKIGEIFEHNGERYQCLEGTGCHKCDFNIDEDTCGIENPYCTGRSDKKDVIFKKLEKDGEPIASKGRTFQCFNNSHTLCAGCVFNIPNKACDKYHYVDGPCPDNEIWVEIKQNKEDMEEKKLNLKPFDLEAAKAGKPICTRDGRKARIICFDRKDNTPIVALIEHVDGIEILQCYHNDGKCFHYETSNNDLMMLSEKRKGWVNLTGSLSHNPHILDVVWDTKEEALDFRRKAPINANIIATGKITWEE